MKSSRNKSEAGRKSGAPTCRLYVCFCLFLFLLFLDWKNFHFVGEKFPSRKMVASRYYPNGPKPSLPARSASTRPKNGACHACFSHVDANRLIKCDSCPKIKHFYCLVPPLLEIPCEWRCEACKQRIARRTLGAELAHRKDQEETLLAQKEMVAIFARRAIDQNTSPPSSALGGDDIVMDDFSSGHYFPVNPSSSQPQKRVRIPPQIRSSSPSASSFPNSPADSVDRGYTLKHGIPLKSGKPRNTHTRQSRICGVGDCSTLARKGGVCLIHRGAVRRCELLGTCPVAYIKSWCWSNTPGAPTHQVKFDGYEAPITAEQRNTKV